MQEKKKMVEDELKLASELQKDTNVKLEGVKMPPVMGQKRKTVKQIKDVKITSKEMWGITAQGGEVMSGIAEVQQKIQEEIR